MPSQGIPENGAFRAPKSQILEAKSENQGFSTKSRISKTNRGKSAILMKNPDEWSRKTRKSSFLSPEIADPRGKERKSRIFKEIPDSRGKPRKIRDFDEKP